jgi:hypothetical protein
LYTFGAMISASSGFSGSSGSVSLNIGGASTAAFLDGQVTTADNVNSKVNKAWSAGNGRTSAAMMVGDPTGIVS